MQFFSRGAYRNPMVVRVAGLAVPGGLRRALPQRQLGGRAARHPRPGGGGAGAGRRRRAACCGPAWRRPRSTAASACSWSRSRSTTPATCTPRATASGWPRTSGPEDWAGDARADRPGPGLPGRLRRGPDDHHVRQRRADVAAGRGPPGRARGSAPGWWTCAGWRRCRWPTSSARRPPPAGCWSWTRRGAPAGSARGCWPRWSTPATSGAARRVAAVDSFVPLGPAARARARRRGCDHRGCPGPAGAVDSRAADEVRVHASVRHLREALRTVWTTRERRGIDGLREACRQ